MFDCKDWSFNLVWENVDFSWLLYVCHNDPKFSDRQVLANNVDPDQTAPDQGLQCLPFYLHLSDTLFYGKITLLKF